MTRGDSMNKIWSEHTVRVVMVVRKLPQKGRRQRR